MAVTITHGKRERFNFKNAICHITTRCNNKQNLITDDYAFVKYLSILKKCKIKYGFLLYDYVIMHNHTHLLIKLVDTENISAIMHSINRWYARWHNEHYERKGHFWEDRFYGELVKNDTQLLAVMRYIDLNPVRAGLCKNSTDWNYSGARTYLSGEKNDLIDKSEVYINLGVTDEERQKTYSYIFPFNLANLTRLE
ncbi:MAG: transposase [Candidatus Omnitrophota bacterium]|nr:transposase [Candidatus Omnitrophota bacterium]